MTDKRTLWREMDIANRKWLEMRDAKSNGLGCGDSLLEVLAYDRKMEQAYKEYETKRDRYLQAVREG